MSLQSVRRLAVSLTVNGIFCGNAAIAGSGDNTHYKTTFKQEPTSETMILMGLKHIYGDGVERSHVRALMWFKLAAATGQFVPPQYFGLTEARMTPLQVARAEAFAEICAESNYTECE